MPRARTAAPRGVVLAACPNFPPRFVPRSYVDVQADLARSPRRWLVTGAAGFIGSSLVESLLRMGQTVVGLDNFATGHVRNLDDVRARAGEAAARFTFLDGDVRDMDVCRAACANVDVVLHQAALGSVPRSIADPMTSHAVNVNGTLNVFVAARDAGIRRVVYASSSSVYGDHPALPKVEPQIGTPLSPYAVTKRTNELYADTFARHYGLETVGLRYFNVFGRRQDPDGAYAAVMPKWVAALLRHEPCVVYGDGETSRDFCYIENVVQANVLAATAEGAAGVYNVAVGERATLGELFVLLREGLTAYDPAIATAGLDARDFRVGDVRHSLADISRAAADLGYAPTHTLRTGLGDTLAWYVEQASR